MTQSTTIAFALVVAWIIFVTAKGKLPSYMAIFGMTASGSGTTASPGADAAPTPDRNIFTGDPFGFGMVGSGSVGSLPWFWQNFDITRLNPFGGSK